MDEVKKAIYKVFNQWDSEYPAVTIRQKSRMLLMEEGIQTFSPDDVDKINFDWIHKLRGDERFKCAFNLPRGSGATGSGIPSGGSGSPNTGGIYRSSFDTEADWELWGCRPTAKIWEACFLSLNANPESLDELEKEVMNAKRNTNYGIPKICKQIQMRIEIAVGNLPENGGDLPVFRANEGGKYAIVKIAEFGGWAKSIGWDLPESFPVTEPEIEGAFSFDEYPDAYPPELDIAMIAWWAVAVKGQGGEGTPKQRILNYLNDNYKKLNGTEKERLAMVCNWRKKGGAPKKG